MAGRPSPPPPPPRAGPQRVGGVALAGRPAPVQGRVVGGEGVDAFAEPAEGEYPALGLGGLEGEAGDVKAGAVHLEGGGAERGAEGTAAGGGGPVHLGGLGAHEVGGLPPAAGADEQAL